MAGLPPIVVPGQVLVYDGEVQNIKDPKRRNRIDVLANERCPAGPLRRIPSLLPPGLTTPVAVGDMVTLWEFPGQRIYWVAKAEVDDAPDWAEETPRKWIQASHDGRLFLVLDPESGVVRIGTVDADEKAAIWDRLKAIESVNNTTLTKILTLLSGLKAVLNTIPPGGAGDTLYHAAGDFDPDALISSPDPNTPDMTKAKTKIDGDDPGSDVVLIPKELPQE